MRDKEPDETWKVDLDFETKDGRAIEMHYSTNVEEKNRGLVCDEIVAYVGGERAGFIRTQNLPTESISRYYPSGPLNYVNNFDGIPLFGAMEDWHRATDIKTASLETLNSLVSTLRSYAIIFGVENFSTRDDFKKWFDDDFKKSRWYKLKNKQFQDFCDDENKPFVIFASTDSPNRIYGEKSWEGLGIGRAMYLAMALELDKRGMALRRSSMSSDSAVRLWNSFERDGLTVPGKVVNGVMQPQLSADLIRERINLNLPQTSALMP